MHKSEAVTLQALQNKTFAAKKARPEFLRERDPDADAFGGAQKRVFLGEQFATNRAEVNRNDFAGIWSAKRHPPLIGTVVLEHRHEHGFTGEDPPAGAHQRPEESAALL